MRPSRRLDVVVVGAGPAGLAAADAVAALGRSVLLIDQGSRGGGQVWRHRPGERLPRAARRLLGAVQPPRVAVARRAAVIDAASPHELVVDFDGRTAIIETSSIVLATGAVERFLPFPGWTLPGVVGVGAMQALCKSGLELSGARVVLAGTGPLLLPVAATLRRAGARLVLIGEQVPARRLRRFAMRALLSPARLAQALQYRAATWPVPYRSDTWVVRAEGHHAVERAILSVGGEERVEPCDWIATAAGLLPRTELGTLLGCAVGDDGIVVDQQQATSIDGVWAAGECCGVAGDDAAQAEGAIAGMAAAGATEIPAALGRRRDRGRAFGWLLREEFAPRRELLDRVTPRTVICRCEDVRQESIDPAWSQRQAKLWTRVAMGACQGAVCGPACEALYGWRRNAVRPPLEQPSVGAWASALERLTPDPVAVGESPPQRGA